MVKLYKTATTYRAICCINGKRIRRTSTNLETAEQLAMDIAQEVNQMTDPSLVMTTQDKIAYRALEMQLPKGVKLADAVEFFLKNHKAMLADARTTAQAVEDRINHLRKTGVSQRHIEETSQTLSKFVAAVPENLADVKHTHIEAWLRTFKAATTRNARLRTVAAVFNRAKRMGQLPAHTPTAAELVHKHAEPLKDPVLIKPDHLKQVLEAVRKHKPRLLAAVAIKAFAGLRTAEVSRITTEDILWDQGVIALTSSITKTRRRRLVNLYDPIDKWLNACDYIKEKGLKITPKNFFLKLNTALKKAGVAPIPHNALRHTCATAYLAIGMNSSDVAGMMGHSVAVLESTYKGLMTKDEARKFFTLMPDENI